MAISVDAVADKPIIKLVERDIPTRQVVHTDFENVTNWNKDSDTLYWFNSGNTGGSVWNATSAKWGKLVGFEFFSKEDYVTTANGKKTKLTASPSGNHWLMLHDGVTLDGRYKSSQLLGIDKNIKTIKDVLYTISFDYSAMLELKSDKLSRIEIYANGKLLGSHQGVSSNNLNWTNLSYDFIGTGNNTSIQILLDGVAINDQSSKGRMAMIDNLSVVETLTARIDDQGAHLYALAGVSTPLPLINISSSDKDGSEAYSLQIVVPYGVIIGDGTYSITNPYRNPITMDLTGMDLSKLTLQTPNHYCGDMSLTLIAKSREISNGSDAMSTYDIKVTVLQGEPAIVNNADITSTLSPSSVQHEADINSEVTAPVLNIRNKQTSPHANAPVYSERSGKIYITVAAQPVRVDDFAATDNWLANMESKAHTRWLV